MTQPSFSFEMFPPKTLEGVTPLMNAVHALATLKPAYFTVTFGAGGTGPTGTAELAQRIQTETGTPTAAHLTFIRLTRNELGAITGQLWQNGITRLVALRGDFPPGWQAPDYAKGEHYRYTDEFVRGIKAQHDFDISVAAYPEKHPDAPDLASDIEALRKKCAAGANRAITQFFFDNSAYFRFLDRAEKAGIQTPIVPGLLPILNFSKAVSFAEKCGAHIPPWVHARFAGLSEEDAAKVAAELLATQVEGLKAKGATHFHFYTLNKSGLCEKTCRAAGLA